MAQVALSIGGRSYQLACRTGEEERFRALAAIVDAKAGEATEAMGGLNETRTLLFAALLLADQIEQDPAPEHAPPSSPASPALAPDPTAAAVASALGHLAARLETLADQLEGGRPLEAGLEST